MDWKREALGKLKNYEAMRSCLQAIPLELQRLELDAQKIRSADPGRVAVKGGILRDDALLNNIVHRQELQNQLSQAQCWVRSVEQALSALPEEQRQVLRQLYIVPRKGALEQLCGELGVEQSTVYRRRDQALRQFTTALYGANGMDS